jgi:hypothetical protein
MNIEQTNKECRMQKYDGGTLYFEKSFLPWFVSQVTIYELDQNDFAVFATFAVSSGCTR